MKDNLITEKVRDIGPRIRSLLDENQIKVKDAAYDLNIELTHYYRLLKGERPMTIDNVIAHSEYLEASILYILLGIEGKDVIKSKVVEPGEINMMIDLLAEAIMKLDSEDKKEKLSRILNVLNVLVKSMN